VLEESQKLLLQIATPESVIRLKDSQLTPEEKQRLSCIYIEEECHQNIIALLQSYLACDTCSNIFIQVSFDCRISITIAIPSDFNEFIVIIKNVNYVC
jgi:hypothetical protein